MSAVVSAPARKSRLVSLTALRGICSLMIYATHIMIFNGSHPLFVQHFSTATSLFFTLSGFMMTWCYDKCDFVSWKCKGQFLSRRFARLYPPLIVAWIWYIYLIKDAQEWNYLLEIVYSIPLLYHSVLLCTYNGHLDGLIQVLWAVSAEFVIYGVYVFTVPFIKQWFNKARARNSHWLWKISFWGVFPFIMYAAIVVPLIHYFLTNAGVANNEHWCTLRFTGWARMPAFFLGLIGGYFALYYVHPRWQRASARTQRIAGWCIDVILIFIGVFVLMLIPLFETFVDIPLRAYTNTSALTPLTVLVITLLSLDTGIIASCMSWHPLQVLGNISYHIYIFHWAIAETFRNVHYDTNYAYFYTMPFTLAICYVVSQYYSEPANTYVIQLFKNLMPSMACKCRRPTPVAAVASPGVTPLLTKSMAEYAALHAAEVAAEVATTVTQRVVAKAETNVMLEKGTTAPGAVYAVYAEDRRAPLSLEVVDRI